MKLTDILYSLPQDEIVDIIGSDLVDLMSQWGENFLNKNALVAMAVSLKGGQIFQNVDHRGWILRANLSAQDISKLGSELGLKRCEARDVLSACRARRWSELRFAILILKYLKLSDEYLPAAAILEESQLEIVPGDRFYELLEYQFLVKSALLAWIRSRSQAKCLIHMPTGSGKTKTCVHSIIDHWNNTEKNTGLVVWLAHTEELLRQALYTFEQCWRHLGGKSVTIYKCWGGFDLPNGDLVEGIIFGGVGKFLNMQKRNDSFWKSIKKNICIVVIDEAHKAKAERTQELIDELILIPPGSRNRCLIGLSATPGRHFNDDEENKELAHFFDDKIIPIKLEDLRAIRKEKSIYEGHFEDSDIVAYLQKHEILATLDRETIEVTEQESNLTADEKRRARRELAGGRDESDLSQKILNKIGHNQLRNMKILNKLIYLHKQKLPTIVFACSVEHAKMLTAALHLRDIPAGCVLGDTLGAERKRIISGFKDPAHKLKILINYAVLTTGFDAPNIQCVFITRPTHSIVLYSQMIGRGLRGPKMGGNKTCLLVDVEDNILKFSSESLAFNYFNDYWRR